MISFGFLHNIYASSDFEFIIERLFSGTPIALNLVLLRIGEMWGQRALNAS